MQGHDPSGNKVTFGDGKAYWFDGTVKNAGETALSKGSIIVDKRPIMETSMFMARNPGVPRTQNMIRLTKDDLRSLKKNAEKNLTPVDLSHLCSAFSWLAKHYQKGKYCLEQVVDMFRGCGPNASNNYNMRMSKCAKLMMNAILSRCDQTDYSKAYI